MDLPAIILTSIWHTQFTRRLASFNSLGDWQALLHSWVVVTSPQNRIWEQPEGIMRKKKEHVFDARWDVQKHE
jgi:hypothetical protein